MQNPFRVAVRLRAAHEDQVAGGPECRAVVAGRHRPIVWITGVLAVDDFGHAPERRHDLLVVDDAMQQPVGNVLAGNAQGGTILHQADVVDIRHLRAAHALVDPAHHIAENALAVVVELLLDRVRRPVRLRNRDGQEVGQPCAPLARELGLARGDVDLVIV